MIMEIKLVAVIHRILLAQSIILTITSYSVLATIIWISIIFVAI